jgi:hypothetical protein
MPPTWNGKLALSALALTLAACQPADEPSNQEPANLAVVEPSDPPTVTSAPENTNDMKPTPDPASEDPVGTLPPAGQGLRFVGRWAAEADLCSTTAWRFTRDSLRTPAGSACAFTKVTPVAGGYDIAATCTAEGPPASDVLEIRFAESARAMLFESDSIADAGLIYCGR